MSRVFVNAWVGADNHGDELLFERLRAHLATAGVTHVTVTSLDPTETRRRHDVDAVGPRSLAAVVRSIRRADLFIVGPGGLLQDGTSPWNLPYQLHRALLARLLRVPILGMGLGADPMNRPGSGTFLRLALGRATTIAVRDDASRRALADHGVDSVTTADLAFGSPVPAEVGGTAIVVSLRPHRRRGLVPVRWQQHRLDAAQIAAAAAALDRLSSELDAPVRFVAFEPHTDQPLHEAVATRMSRPATCAIPAAGRLVDEMADARLVVATRYHAGITALVAGRPTVLIGYAPKVRSLADATGVPLLADTDLALAGLVDAAHEAMRSDAALAVDGLRAAESRNGEIIAAVLADDAH